jgi:hypothetical protein
VAEEKSVVNKYEVGDLRKFKDKWATKAEFETYKAVQERFEVMDKWRQSSCPFPSDPNDINIFTQNGKDGKVSTSGSSWVTFWKEQEVLYYPYKKKIKDRSNVKSPIIWAAIQADQAEFQDNRISFILEEGDDIDTGKARFIHSCIEQIEYEQNNDENKARTKEDSSIYGTSWAHTPYIRQIREVEVVLDKKRKDEKIKNITDGKDDQAKEDLKKKIEVEKKPVTEMQKRVEFAGSAYIPVSIYEVYPDPDFIEIRGLNRPMKDLIWRTTPTAQSVIEEMEMSTDPYILRGNIKKIMSSTQSSQGYEDNVMAYSAPQGIGEDRCEVKRYWNKITDKHIILVNDVVLRDGPIPDNTKEIPFVMHRYFKHSHHSYGFGLPFALKSLQSEDETLRNMMIEQIRLNIIRPLFINSGVFEDVDVGLNFLKAGAKVSVNGSVGQDNIRWMDAAQIPFDAAQMRQSLEKDAIKTSGIDTILNGVPRQGEAVRNNLMSVESTQKMIKKAKLNWAVGYIDWVKMCVAQIQQHWVNEHDNPDILGKDYKRNIKIKGAKLYDNGGDLVEEPGDKDSYIMFKPGYVSLKANLQVTVDMDTILPPSKSLIGSNIVNLITQIAPIYQQLVQMPGGIDIVREAFRVNGMPKRIVDKLQTQDSDKEVEDAKSENEIMKNGQEVEGTPGRSDRHKLVHSNYILELILEKNDIMSKDNEPHLAMLAPDPRVREIDATIQMITRHMIRDNTPKNQATDQALSVAQPAPQPQQAPPMGQTMPTDGQMPQAALEGAPMI